MSFENELGVLKPVGFWDPLGLSNGITQEKFDQYRTAELKHGRVSQLAVVGYLAQENFRIAGYLSPVDKLKFDDVTNGVAAITQVPILGWLQLIALVGFFESVVWKQIPGEPIGSFYGAYNGPAPDSDMRNRELQHGRLAMLGIMELLTHDIATQGSESLFTLHHF